MTTSELNTLHELLTKLREKRKAEIIKECPEMKDAFDNNEYEAIYEYDDGDNLVQGIDEVLWVVEHMKGE